MDSTVSATLDSFVLAFKGDAINSITDLLAYGFNIMVTVALIFFALKFFTNWATLTVSRSRTKGKSKELNRIFKR